jgi:integrase
LWLASGESPQWIADQLGHTTTEMLFRVYARYVPNLTRRDGSAFERLITGVMGNGERQLQLPEAANEAAVGQKEASHG